MPFLYISSLVNQVSGALLLWRVQYSFFLFSFPKWLQFLCFQLIDGNLLKHVKRWVSISAVDK